MRQSILLLVVCGLASAAAVRQQAPKAGKQAAVAVMAAPQDGEQDEAMPQVPGAKVIAKPKLPVPAKNAPLTPLNQRDRTLQLLDRFTFGARPREI